MYFFSPFYVKWLYINPEKALKSCKIIVVISVLLNFFVTVGLFGGLFGVPFEKAGEIYWKQVYQKTYMRLPPYIFGMIAALRYTTQHDKDILSKTPLWKEWVAFVFVLLTGFIGGLPFVGTPLEALTLIWLPCFRAFYGAALSFLILLMISPDSGETISWSRPTKLIRSFLSL